jgi:hypothetical protein
METPKKKRFPWVLYARKFRNNRANVWHLLFFIVYIRQGGDVDG